MAVVDYVQNNPSEMVNAYFLIMWLKVYECVSPFILLDILLIVSVET